MISMAILLSLLMLHCLQLASLSMNEGTVYILGYGCCRAWVCCHSGARFLWGYWLGTVGCVPVLGVLGPILVLRCCLHYAICTNLCYDY